MREPEDQSMPPAPNGPNKDDPSIGALGPTDETLTQLLTRAHRPPQMTPIAKERIKRVLLKAQANRRAEISVTTPAVQPLGQLHYLRTALKTYGMAAAVALLATAFVLVFPAGQTTFENTDDHPIRVVLSDGSAVILDRGTRLEQTDARDVRLDHGRAWFDVASADDEFSVTTPNGIAEAHGTQFLVEAGQTSTYVSVAQGRVALENDRGQTTLLAGDAGQLSAEGEPTKNRADRLSHLTNWTRAAQETETVAAEDPIRRGNLLARDTRSGKEWPLPVSDLTVDVHIEGPVARTTIDQTFFNHTHRQLEGTYSFPLPADAAISRLAMYVDGHLMEGGIVERNRGRDIYESIVHQRRDPALLEWMSGNMFRIRVFPLPPRRQKRLFLSYTQTLDSLYDTRRLSVPIPELDGPVGTVTYRVEIESGRDFSITSPSHALRRTFDGDDVILTFEAKDHHIGRDLMLEIRREEMRAVDAFQQTEDGERFVMLQAHPELPASSQSRKARSWTILYDTSGSRQPTDLAMQRSFVEAFIAQIDDRDRFAIVSVDTEAVELTDGLRIPSQSEATKFGAALGALQGRGESRLAVGLDRALAVAATDGEREPYIVYVGDGIATGDVLNATATAEKLAGKATFVGVALGESKDRNWLAQLAEQTGGLHIDIPEGDDLRWRAFDLVANLNTARAVGVKARLVDGGGRSIGQERLFSPRQLSAGEPATVIASLRTGDSVNRLELSGTIDGRPWNETFEVPDPTDAPFVRRLWAQRRVGQLIQSDAEAGQSEITKLGLDNFLVTPFTSLLVLETDEQYANFNVRRSGEHGWAAYRAPKDISDATIQKETIKPQTGELLTRHPQFLPDQTRSRGYVSAYQTEEENGLLASMPTTGAFQTAVIRSGRRSNENQDRIRNTMSDLVLEAASDGAAIDSPDPAWTLRKSVEKAGPSKPSFVLKDDRGQGQLSGELGNFGFGGSPAVQGIAGRSHYYRPMPAVDDLTELVPALFTDEIDLLQELANTLHADGDASTTRPEDALIKARDAANWSRMQPSAGTDSYLASNGALLSRRGEDVAIQTITPTGLVQRQVLADGKLTAFYPALRLAVRRPVDRVAPFLFAQLAPFWLPYAPLGAVALTSSDPTNFKLTLGDQTMDVTFDAQRRIESVRRSNGAQVSVQSDGDQLTLTGPDGTRISMRPSSERADTDASIPDGWTVVEMPLRVDDGEADGGVADAIVLDRAPRATLGQRLAHLAAQHRYGHMRPVLMALTTRFGLRRGELILASGVFPSLSEHDVDQLAAGIQGSGGDSASNGDDAQPNADFLAQLRVTSTPTNTEDLGQAIEPLTEYDSIVGQIAAYRLALYSLARDDERVVEHIERFFERGPGTGLATSLLGQIENQWRYSKRQELVELWQRLAQMPHYELEATLGLARSHALLGQTEAARKSYLKGYDLATEQGLAVTIDAQWANAFRAGQAGDPSFDVLWSRYRRDSLQSPHPARWLALMESMSAVGRTDSVTGLLRTLAEHPKLTFSMALALSQEMLKFGEPSAAIDLMLPFQEGPKAPMALAVMSLANEALGQPKIAAELSERALDARQDGVPLSTLRSETMRIFDLYLEDARGRRTSLDQALRVADQSSVVDPDNPELDIRVARELYRDGQAGRAWRYLSSIIERHPAEGSAYAQVAEILEQVGYPALALAQWRRAVAVEPTNPNWSLRLAQSLLAADETREATQLLRSVRSGTYQDRFSQAVRLAEELLRMIEPKAAARPALPNVSPVP